MTDEDHVAVLKQGVEVWNKWREENPDVKPDLREADLREADLEGADLREVDLEGADLYKANLARANLARAKLSRADLSEATLSRATIWDAKLVGARLFMAQLYKAELPGANLHKANLVGARLSGAMLVGAKLVGADLVRAYLPEANLFEANLVGADLSTADLSGAKLSGARLSGARLAGAKLHKANLSGADLSGATLSEADLSRADLAGVDLMYANLVEADLTDADLTSCHIYGISVWGLKLSKDTKQRNLVITKRHEPEITVDDLEVAQFIYLLLHNERIRNVIDTITSKAVLILGRFTPERKVVLDALREELRKRNYLPILFDFDKPDSKDLTGTVQTLANMARFIIADLTEPSCIPHELAMLVPTTVVPVRPILLVGQHEYAMFIDLKRRHSWVLEPYSYDSSDRLIAGLNEVIRPAEAKALELRGLIPEQAGSPTA